MNDNTLTMSKLLQGKPVSPPNPVGTRKQRRAKAKAERKAKKQAYKILRGGIGNNLIALPVSDPQKPVTSVP